MIQTIQLLTYKFMWGKQREVAWASMIVPREEGGARVHDFLQIQIASLVECCFHAWNREGL